MRGRVLTSVGFLAAALAGAAGCSWSGDREPAGGGVAVAEAPAPGSDSGVVARRMLSAAQFSDHGYPSADGRLLATIDWDTGDLALRDLSTGALRRLGVKRDGWMSSSYIEFARVSPDGSRIAYVWSDEAGQHSVRVVNADGSGMREVLRDTTYNYMEINGFAPDNRHVLVELDHHDGRLDYGWLDLDDRSLRPLFARVTWVLGDVFFSPDGRYAVYNGGSRHPSVPGRDPMILEIATSRSWPLIAWPSDDMPMGWSADGGSIVFVSDRGGAPAFWLQPVRNGRADGAARLLRAEAWNVSGLGITRDGRLLYAVRTGAVHLYQASLDTTSGTVVGEPVRLDERPARYINTLGVSNSGDWLAYVIPARTALAGPSAITLRSTVTGETRELRTGMSFFMNLALWSPDDSRLLVWGNDSLQRAGLFAVDVTSGRLTTVKLRERTARSWAAWPGHLGWTRDGQAVILALDQPDSSQLLVARDLATGADRPLARRAKNRRLPLLAQLSGDGRQVALLMPGAASNEVVLRVEDLAGTSGRDLVRSRPPGRLAAVKWSRDGRWLYTVRADVDDGRVHVERISATGGASRDIGISLRGNYAAVEPHPDGRQLFFTAGENASELWALEHFLPRTPSP